MSVGIVAMFKNALEVYEYMCRPVCEAGGIQYGELSILLFLANNPEKNTAMDVHRCAGLKQSMISMLVEKLVQAGLLERQAIPGDRRKVKLVCTEKAGPVIEAGREVQKKFAAYTMAGASEEDIEAYRRVQELIGRNIQDCRDKMLKGELE